MPQRSVTISQKTERYEQESLSFQSRGHVKTTDGKEIAFEVNLSMSRELYEKSETQVQIGSMEDPLVLNLDGKGVGFSDKKFRLDLNLDGSEESLRWLNSGSGFLAYDQNGNGSIDSGRELFGAKTGDGFAELSHFDDDSNGWIDENDAIFSKLSLWSLDKSGNEQLIALKDADVGALYLGDVAGRYSLKEGDQTVGQITSSSVYLKESGGAGVVHNIDYLF